MFRDCLQLTSHTLNEYDDDDDDVSEHVHSWLACCNQLFTVLNLII